MVLLRLGTTLQLVSLMKVPMADQEEVHHMVVEATSLVDQVMALGKTGNTYPVPQMHV